MQYFKRGFATSSVLSSPPMHFVSSQLSIISSSSFLLSSILLYISLVVFLFPFLTSRPDHDQSMLLQADFAGLDAKPPSIHRINAKQSM